MAGAGNRADPGGESLSDLAAMGLVTRDSRIEAAGMPPCPVVQLPSSHLGAGHPCSWEVVIKADMTHSALASYHTDIVSPTGKEQQLDERSSQQKQQQLYKGLGTNSVVSTDGEPLTRSVDAAMASSGGDGVTAPSATDGAAASGLINSGEADTASGLGGREGLPKEASSLDAGLSGSVGAAGEGGIAGMAEPAKTVSMDGDIIATASKAEALSAAGAESPHVGARV